MTRNILLVILGAWVVNCKAPLSELGDIRADKFKFEESTRAYKKSLYEKKINDIGTLRNIATNYRLTQDYAEAEIWYSELMRHPDSAARDPFDYFYYAKMLQTNGHFTQSKIWMRRFKSVQYTKDAKLTAVLDYERALNLFDRDSILVNNVTYNSSFDDFCPVVSNGDVVFCSNRPAPAISDKIYPWDNKPFLNLYHVKQGESDPQLLRNEFNSAFHDGPVCFDQQGKRAWLTRNMETGYSKDFERQLKSKNLKILIFNQTSDTTWNTSDPFVFNDDTYSSGHVAISPNGTTIIFSSDKPGGAGQADLYISEWKEGRWTTPTSAGEHVNTFANEVFPYFLNDSTVIFSSDALPGYGGLDFFEATLRNAQLVKPENLGLPFNSLRDDFGIFFTDNRHGYFSSNRNGTDDDIFAFEIPDRVLHLDIFVVDKHTRQLIVGAKANLSADLSLISAFTQKEKEAFTIKNPPKVTYNIFAEADEYIPEADTFRLDQLSLQNKRYRYTIALQRIPQLPPIYFDLDKSFIRKDAEPTLDSAVAILKQFPQLELFCTSHCDCRHTYQYNIKLSERRVKSSIKYIASNGIDPSRLISAFEGEFKLVNDCKCEASRPVEVIGLGNFRKEEDEHQRNRRTEFIFRLRQKSL